MPYLLSSTVWVSRYVPWPVRQRRVTGTQEAGRVFQAGEEDEPGAGIAGVLGHAVLHREALDVEGHHPGAVRERVGEVVAVGAEEQVPAGVAGVGKRAVGDQVGLEQVGAVAPGPADGVVVVVDQVRVARATGEGGIAARLDLGYP